MNKEYFEKKQFEIISCLAKEAFNIPERKRGIDAILKQIAADQREYLILKLNILPQAHRLGGRYTIYLEDAIAAVRSAEIK